MNPVTLRGHLVVEHGASMGKVEGATFDEVIEEHVAFHAETSAQHDHPYSLRPTTKEAQ